MNNKKIIFCTGEGIGNTIQCLPTVRTLVEVLGYEVDFWHMFGSFHMQSGVFKYIRRWITNKNLTKKDLDSYEGKVVTYWAREHAIQGPIGKVIPLNIHTPLTMDRSEVDTYMDIARTLGASEEDLLWEAECNHSKSDRWFDVVISDGYNRQGAARWEIKSYPDYEKVVDKLVKMGYKVCSIGAKDEYIPGTIDMTGLSLMYSLGVIKSSRVLLSNDSGMYHCANALGTPSVVLFTATSIEKNYDKRFHRYTTILGRDDLECRPCQEGRGWSKCKDWKCQQIDPDLIVGYVTDELTP